MSLTKVVEFLIHAGVAEIPSVITPETYYDYLIKIFNNIPRDPTTDIKFVEAVQELGVKPDDLPEAVKQEYVTSTMYYEVSSCYILHLGEFLDQIENALENDVLLKPVVPPSGNLLATAISLRISSELKYRRLMESYNARIEKLGTRLESHYEEKAAEYFNQSVWFFLSIKLNQSV